MMDLYEKYIYMYTGTFLSFVIAENATASPPPYYLAVEEKLVTEVRMSFS